jgi:hypothetical protein
MFTMLHLKCFHALGTWDAVGGTGTRVWRGAEDRAISISVLFQYVGRDSVNSIHGDERVYEGDRRPDTLTRRMFGR